MACAETLGVSNVRPRLGGGYPCHRNAPSKGNPVLEFKRREADKPVQDTATTWLDARRNGRRRTRSRNPRSKRAARSARQGSRSFVATAETARALLRAPCVQRQAAVCVDGERVAYRGRCPQPGGRTHRLISRMPCMARVSTFIPPPGFPLVQSSGVLAPGAKWCSFVVPRGESSNPSKRIHAWGPRLAPQQRQRSTLDGPGGRRWLGRRARATEPVGRCGRGLAGGVASTRARSAPIAWTMALGGPAGGSTW